MASYREILLMKRPQGIPMDSDYQLVTREIPEPGADEMLVKVLYAAMDPAIRGWMDASGNYFEPIPLQSPVRSVVLGHVVKSNIAEHPEGQIVSGLGSWSEYILAGPGQLAPVPTDLGVELPAFLHVLGPVGATAYYGLFEIGQLKDGEKVLVSGAAGGVGSLVGQMAKAHGCKVVGIAGGAEKCAWIEELGFDASIDYRQFPDRQSLSMELARHFPDGFDVYFENVGGYMLEAAMDNMAKWARIAICGMISGYNATEPVSGPDNMWNLLVKTARIEGLLVADYFPRAMDGYQVIAEMMQKGQLHYKLDIRQGLESIPQTFNCLFDGRHDGKLIVQISQQDREGERKI